MKEDFSFEQVGKRMPYDVPEGFFNDLETSVMARIARRRRARLIWWSGAAAAVVAAVMVCANIWHRDNTSLDSVVADYECLSNDDQEYLAQYYDSDFFFYDDSFDE